jgi:hypothetical protein
MINAFPLALALSLSPREEGRLRGTSHGCHGKRGAYGSGLMIDYPTIFNYDAL